MDRMAPYAHTSSGAVACILEGIDCAATTLNVEWFTVKLRAYRCPHHKVVPIVLDSFSAVLALSGGVLLMTGGESDRFPA
jgi:hypothetical protein